MGTETSPELHILLRLNRLEELMSATSDVHQALRAYAGDCGPCRAVAEILIRAHDGKYATPEYIRVSRAQDRVVSWIEPLMLLRRERITPQSELLTLELVESLVKGTPIDIGKIMVGVDDATRDVTLAALAFIGVDASPQQA